MTLSVLIPKRVFKATLPGRRNESAGRIAVCFGLVFFPFQFCYPSLELLGFVPPILLSIFGMLLSPR